MRSNCKLFILLVFFSLVLVSQGVKGQSKEDKDQIQKLVTVMQIIDYAYVDSLEMDELVEDMIISSLRELDPHSAYISKENLDRMNEPLEGSFEGIGVSFQVFHDTILVIAPVPGGPSEKLGIMAGDKIVKIDGEDATGKDIDNQWVMDHLRGKKDTKVDVSIYRKGRKALIDYTITRDKIPLNSIDATFMAAPGIGYIKLNRFSKTSMDEFEESLYKLKSQGMQKLILDLRGNAGGYLGTAADLSDEFLDHGKLIVYTEGLKSPKQDFKSTILGSFEKGKLVILINEGSASASEIVSGAVQDWDRGLIVGRRSFGKGLVQRPFPLPDGSVIRLTTAKYYTPSGRYIQRPYDNGIEDYYMEFRKRYEHGELIHSDSIHFPDSLKYQTTGGRTVYGGGGIMPDIFVPWDSTWYSDYYADLRRKGLLNQYTVDVVDKNRERLLETYPDIRTFKEKFVFNEALEKEFLALAESEDVEFDQEGWDASGKVIRTQIKALIARNLWDMDAYFEVSTVIDDGFQKAVEILQDDELFDRLGIDQ